MKKLNILLILLMAGITNLFAQMDNLSNMSAEWMRTAARNAATDASDIVVYNPAGLTKLKTGLHVNISNQSLFRNPSHSYDLGLGEGVKEFSQGKSDPFLPNLYVAYTSNKWALYSGVFFSGGGATADYPQGSITTDLIGLGALTAAQGAYTSIKDPMLKASSMYLTNTLGGSYEINPVISVSAAIRYIQAKNTSEAGITMSSSPMELPDMAMSLKTEDNATGFGGIFSVNVTAIDKLGLSLRYESNVNLNFKTTQDHDDFGLTTDGATNRRDLPAVLAFGASYKCSTKLKIFSDINHYFQKNANWGKSGIATDEEPLSLLAGNATTYALGFQYKVSEKFTASAGAGMTEMNFNDKAGYYTNLGTFEIVQSDNTNINMGFAFKASEKITVNTGYMHTFYPADQKVKALNAQPLDVDVTVNNSINAVALGLELTF
jgi:long-chain fatty acid transport protein